MKKFSVLVFIILGLTIFSFLFSQRLMELIVRIQRSEDPSKVTAEDLMQEVDPVMVAAVQFDQMAIEFYYDISQLENDGLYYTASGKNQRITYPQNFINSINDQYRFFADFNNEFEIYQDDELLKPYQTIEIQINQLNKTIPLYQLDKSKKTTLKSVYTEHDYSFYCFRPDCFDGHFVLHEGAEREKVIRR